MLTIAVIAIMIIALFAACIKGAYYSPEDREDDEVWCRLHVDENGKLHEKPPIDEIGYDIPDYTDDIYWGI